MTGGGRAEPPSDDERDGGRGNASFREAALLLVGHGSSRVAGSGESVRAQAEALTARGIFAEVHAAFLREQPLLAEVREALSPTSDVYVVPMFTCRGFICDTLVPRVLGLTGTVTSENDRRYLLCEPVGSNPRVIDLIAARIRAMLEAFRLSSRDASVLLIAHGTARDPESFRQTRRVAAALRERGEGLDVQAAFLEQAPRVEEGPARCRHRDVLVIPFMIAAGAHGAIDLPQRLGLDPADPRMAALFAAGQTGPFTVGGTSLYLGRAFGSEPELADLVLEQVADFRRRFSA